METRELALALFDELREPCEGAGFKYLRTRGRFVREVPGARQAFVVSFAVYNWLEVIPGLSLRLHDVEAIFHRTSGFDKKYQSETATLDASLRSLSSDLTTFTYRIATRGDVPGVACRIEQNFQEVVLPYFATNTSLSRVDSLLNSNPEAPCPHNMNEYHRCAYGLIVGHLCLRKDYSHLVEVYRKKMATTNNGFFLARVDALVNDLLSMTR
jgi:hypothetical protein